MFNKRVGDPDDPQDRKRLKKQESDQIVVAARENGVPVQYIVAPEEGHGFEKENNRLAVAAQLERFFGEHLGGRYQTNTASAVQERLDALTVNPDSVTLPDTTATAAASSDAKGGVSMMDGSKLAPATLSYNATMKVRGKSIDLSSTRTITATSTKGTPTWTVVNKTQTPRATVTDSLIMDRSTLRPVSQHQRGPITVNVTYTDTSASGTMKVRGHSTSISTTFDAPTLAGGSHDLVALGTMPMEPGFSTSLPVFTPRRQKVRTANFKVTGMETVKTPAGSFDTYVVERDGGQRQSYGHGAPAQGGAAPRREDQSGSVKAARHPYHQPDPLQDEYADLLGGDAVVFGS
jgi:hypothetical protein